MTSSTAPHERYALSFTSGGLLLREADVVASEYLRTRDWAAARQSVIGRNLLQARTSSSSTRITREVIQRLAVLDDAELELLTESSLTERSQLLWAAACRRYDLVGEFADEVVRERFLLMTPTLDVADFERFIAGKSLWHPELEELRQSTRAKLRQSLFRMLHEAGLRNKQGAIIPVVLSERVHDSLARHSPSDIRFFPTSLPTEAMQ